MSKKIDPYNVVFWAFFIGMSLGGFMMIMLAAFMKIQ